MTKNPSTASLMQADLAKREKLSAVTAEPAGSINNQIG